MLFISMKYVAVIVFLQVVHVVVGIDKAPIVFDEDVASCAARLLLLLDMQMALGHTDLLWVPTEFVIQEEV